MAKNLLDRAEKLYRRKKYGEVISLLEPIVLESATDSALSVYRHTFELYFFLGMSCLHTGDTGGACSFLDRAGRIKARNTDLILARAAAAVIQGKLPDACGYYLEVLRRDPANKKATKALEFLRKADEETVRRFVVEKKVFRFCPKPKKKKKGALVAAAAIICACAAGGVLYFTRQTEAKVERADLSDFMLSVDERQDPIEQEGSFTYVLTSRQVVSSYDSIKTYFNDFRDNAAQVEINRLLNSNASAAIRRKARMLMDYLSEPEYLRIKEKDGYSYEQVAAEPLLYMDCWVVWEGMAANVVRGEDSTDFSFLVGYDRNSDLQGIVQVRFERALSFDQERPFELLGQIKSDGGKIVLRGSAIHQSVRPAVSRQGG